ncbi:MAG: TRAP transporter large permease subunit, partial [Alphaproteobacteria bacterium]
VMGVALERSRVAEDLLDAMGRLFGPVRGGLGFAVTIVGALLAASTGIVGATVVTMGLLSLPTMLKRGYDPRLACGTISAAGTLGQIIPPSIVLILLADVLSSAYQQAQRALGIQATRAVSVGELFAGALLPGVMLVLLYLLYQAIVAWLRPAASPAIPRAGEGEGGNGRLWLRLLRVLVAPVVLIVTVLGSILAGIATPTEAAAVGAVGAIMLGALRLQPRVRPLVLAGAAAAALLAAIAGLHGPVAPAGAPGMIAAAAVVVLALAVLASLQALARAGVLGEILLGAVRISTMIYTILIGAAMFSLVFRAFGGDLIVEEALAGLPGGIAGALVTVMVVMFLLGFFLDFIEITFVVVPIVAPILFKMGVDPVWLGVLMAMNLQTSFLTPPFGFALFYLRGVA